VKSGEGGGESLDALLLGELALGEVEGSGGGEVGAFAVGGCAEFLGALNIIGAELEC
jgi:hypothetical protein